MHQNWLHIREYEGDLNSICQADLYEMGWFSISISYVLEIIFGLWNNCDGEIPRWPPIFPASCYSYLCVIPSTLVYEGPVTLFQLLG